MISNTDSTLLTYPTVHIRVKEYTGMGGGRAAKLDVAAVPGKWSHRVNRECAKWYCMASILLPSFIMHVG
jgi:hypothetical protein